VIEAIVWYATEDPDPVEEVWRRRASSGQLFYGGDPDLFGLNSTRGSAAIAIAALLSADLVPAEPLTNAVRLLAQDASIAVRSQAIHALLALFDTEPDLAIQWFVQCVSVDAVLLRMRVVERFVYFAGHHNYTEIRHILQKMICSEDPETVRSGATVSCLLALSIELAAEEAAKVRAGSTAMREAAATVYATNVANKEVGTQCRELLLVFLSDQEEGVRAKAAAAFRHISELDTREQAVLLAAFLDANPSALALEPVIRALEDSPVRLPDLVCRLVETSVDHFNADAANIFSRDALVAGHISKIVIRLYTQSDDDAIKTRCLNSIDRMEEIGFFGLSDELERIDR
jgi:hypothetical protein